MSFSKAKLKRFNEEIPQVPSPGRYDPKENSSIKGATMLSSKRFPGQATTSSSLDNIEKASSALSNVVFRTPQVLRKVMLTPKVQYLKEESFNTSGSDVLSSDERLCVKSASKKTVTRADYKRLEDELSSVTDKYHRMMLDKDLEINILKEEITEIKVHEAELKDILEEKSKLASDRHNETLQLKENLDTVVEKINVDREEHQKYINDLKLEILELQNKKYELETVLAEKQSVIVTINDKYSDLENEFKSLEEENEIFEQANSRILIGAEEKFQQLEQEVMTKLQRFSETLDLRFVDEQNPFQTKMNYFVHEFNLKSKELMAKAKQSQEKVMELETLIDRKVEEFSKDIKETDERCKYLYRELCKVEQQRNELVESDLEKKLEIIEIQEKYNSCQSELEECRNTCRKYQITLNTMNETIAALSNRLLESEQEVERLNEVVKDLESQKQLLEEKSQSLFANNVALRESMDKMEEDITRDVSALKDDLEAKVDLFKAEAMKTEKELNAVICDKQLAIDNLLKENEYFKTEAEKKDEFLEEAKKREKKNEERVKTLNSKHLKLEDELSEKLSAQKNLHTILSNKLESANSLIIDLKHSKSEHKSQIANLEKQLQDLKETLVSLEGVNLEQNVKIQSLQSQIGRKKEEKIKQQQYIDELFSELVLEKERCQAVEAEKDRIKGLLNDAELSIAEKSEEREKLLSHIESLRQSLKNCEEKISIMENDKITLEQQLSNAEANLEKLKLIDSEAQMKLEHQIKDLQCQLSSAKEKIKTEIPKLEHDNINKAENILELNLSIDGLKEEIEHQKMRIVCLETEKNSLFNVLEENKSKIIDLEQVIQDKNLEINALNEEHKKKDALCQELLSQSDSLMAANNKYNLRMKQNAEDSIKLIEAEVKISDLESQLSKKDKDVELLTQRIEEMKDTLEPVVQLREQLEELQVKYNAVVEDRDKLRQEVGDLMGHQNINQKIKKVSELKQELIELKEDNDLLRLENHRLTNKLENSRKRTENKENVTLPRREEKQKLGKPGSAKKKLLSPSVLKPANH